MKWGDLIDHIGNASAFHDKLNETKAVQTLSELVDAMACSEPMPNRYDIDDFGRIILRWESSDGKASMRATIDHLGVVFSGMFGDAPTVTRQEARFTLPRLNAYDAAKLMSVLAPLCTKGR